MIAPPTAPTMPGVYQGVVIACLAVFGITSDEKNPAYAIISWVVMLLCLLGLLGWGLTAQT